MAGRVNLRWTNEAKAELQDIYEYIAARDRAAAKRLVSRIRELARGIVEYPESTFVERCAFGRMVPEYEVPNVRERIYSDYRIIYQLSHRGAEIIALWHAASTPKLGRIALKLFPASVNISLSRGYLSVAKDPLDRGKMIEHVGGERMTKCVWGACDPKGTPLRSSGPSGALRLLPLRGNAR